LSNLNSSHCSLSIRLIGRLKRAITINRNIRLILSFIFVFALLIAAASGLYITEAVLNVWDSVKNRPNWLIFGIVILLSIVVIASVILVIRLLFPRKQHSKHHQNSINSEEELDNRIKQADEAGLDIHQVKQEIAELAQRRAAGCIYIAVFGEVNMGKSSIICALLPDADASVSNIAGTTKQITHYKWQSTAGDQLILTDVPGTEQADASQLSSVARDEALRAHIVIYVCDGDLNRTQYQELSLLSELQKPIIVAFNKSDAYSNDELNSIVNKLKLQLPTNNNVELVKISCDRQESVVRVLANGQEEILSRTIPADVTQLSNAIQNIIDTHETTLDELRDTTVFVLAASHLEKAESAQQKKQAEEIVNQYTKRAVVGALAAVSPGTDIVIQAYLGTSMVKAICETYKVPVRDFDIDTFLKLVQAQVGKSVPVILAIAGNGLKAFPGIGTVVGGLVHATAYGLIFDTLGKTLVRTLSSRGEFQPAATARIFQETLNENLENGTTDFIKIVLAAKQKQNNDN